MLLFAYKQSEGEMKKVIVFVLIAIIAVSSAFAFKFNSVGIEAGNGFHASADMEIIKNLDGYFRLGYTGFFDISLGAQYKVLDFKIGSTPVYLRPGAQMGFSMGDEYFSFSLLGTCALSFDADHLTAFVRPGVGFYTYPSYTYEYPSYDLKKVTKAGFAFLIECGVAYLFN